MRKKYINTYEIAWRKCYEEIEDLSFSYHKMANIYYASKCGEMADLIKAQSKGMEAAMSIVHRHGKLGKSKKKS